MHHSRSLVSTGILSIFVLRNESGYDRVAAHTHTHTHKSSTEVSCYPEIDDFKLSFIIHYRSSSKIE